MADEQHDPQDLVRQLPQVVDFQARLQHEVTRLAKQRVRTSDPSGQITVRISGKLQVDQLLIDDAALQGGAEALAERLTAVFNEALSRANDLALTRLGATGGDWDEMGLPGERNEPRRPRDESDED